METALRIAEFKARLSQHLRAVRGGTEIVVKDRETPIARVVPYAAAANRLDIRLPTRPLKELDRLPGVRLRKLKPRDLERAVRETKMDWLDKWTAEKSTLTRP
ncbi:MAG: hypothetical protein AAB225_25555 [Acidobacteriota bacterium]